MRLEHFPRPGTGLASIALLTACALASCDAQHSIVQPEPERASARVAFDPTPATLEWQQQARALVGLNRFAVLAAERVYAYLSITQYAAISRAKEHESVENTPAGNGFGAGGRALYELERGAVVGASWQMLAYFFPNQEPMLAQLAQLAQEEAASRGATHPQFTTGLEVGKATAQAMILRAQNDGFTTPFTGSIPTGTGMWTANGTPLGATGGAVMPWVLDSGDQFRAPPPPAFGTAAFLADLAEIKAIADTRTDAQLAIARAWAYPGGTFTPAGHWNQLAERYVSEDGLDERAAARVFALMHAAQFDAHVIACFESKYEYWFIRPSQADPGITTPIGLPNHPSYPSGHSCASSAATTVLVHFFPDRQAELQAQRTEAGLSRMYAGIHYRFDITAAVQIGTAIAQLAIDIDQAEGLLSRLQ